MTTLREHDQHKFELEEINHIPDEFKQKLLTDKEPREFSRSGSDNQYNRGGYDQSRRNGDGNQRYGG